MKLNLRIKFSGLETLAYLQKIAEKDQEFKLKKILLRREELELRERELENCKQQKNQMFEYLQTHNSQSFQLLPCKIQNKHQPR